MDALTTDPRPLVLVAEDEFLIGEVLEESLSEAGYRVLRADDGHEAVALLSSQPLFHALVTDIRLERGPDGWQVARMARDINPQAAVVYVTGDSAANWGRDGVPGSAIVQKPFPPAQVVTALARLLSTARDRPEVA